MKKYYVVPLIAIAVILLSLTIGEVVSKDVEFSNNENRYLQTMPELSWKRIFNGKFSSDAEEYLGDQIPGRDLWMSIASTLKKWTGKKDISNTYLGEDGYYFDKVTEDSFNQKQFTKNVRALEEFFDGHTEINGSVMLVPSPATILKDELPEGAQIYDDSSRYEQLSALLGDAVVDVRETLSQQENPYYHTDHHWTTEGAQSAYISWCKATGQDAVQWELTTVSTQFRGTLYSKVLLPDSIWDCVSVAKDATIESMDCDGEISDTLYDMDALDRKDVYTVFQGGNYAKVSIRTNVENGKHILVVKDSFANSFVPFLTENYETITMVDLRYFQESISELMENENVTDVLVLYEMSNFADSNTIFKINQ